MKSMYRSAGMALVMVVLCVTFASSAYAKGVNAKVSDKFIKVINESLVSQGSPARFQAGKHYGLGTPDGFSRYATLNKSKIELTADSRGLLNVTLFVHGIDTTEIAVAFMIAFERLYDTNGFATTVATTWDKFIKSRSNDYTFTAGKHQVRLTDLSARRGGRGIRTLSIYKVIR